MVGVRSGGGLPKLDNDTLEYNAGVARVKPGSIGSDELAVGAMAQQFLGSIDTPALNSTRYLPMMGTVSGGYPTEPRAEGIVTTAFTLTSLRSLNTGAFGAAGGATLTVRKNNADTALTVTWSASDPTNTAKSITGQSVSFAAGDRICLKLVCANTTMPTSISWGVA